MPPKRAATAEPGTKQGSKSSTGVTEMEKSLGLDVPRAKTAGLPGAVASEPPYSDAELGRTFEVNQTLYQPLGYHARGQRIHSGPVKLRKAKVNDRTTWVGKDKAYAPYMVWPAETPLEAKSAGPKKLWLARELHQPKQKGVKGSGPKYAYEDKDIKRSAKKLAARPRWDTEHNVMVSQANEEVQKYVREYFDKPVRKESEGIPKVKELYAMNDRQSGWWDEASPLGLPKHTYLDVLGAWNVGGPKEQQKVSYWRGVVEKSASAPALVKPNIKDSRAAMSLTERLAEMPAKESTIFWRDWVDQSKNRLPVPKAVEKVKEKRAKKGKRGGWPAPGEPQVEEPKAAVTLPAMMRTNTPPRTGPADWNDRWSVLASKDNLSLTMGQRMYFKEAQFLSGAEVGKGMSYD